jgi:acyl dehydratase
MREKIEAVEKKRGDCFAVSRTFTEHDTTTFAEITRDYNPVYFDRSFASQRLSMTEFVMGSWVAASSPRSADRLAGWHLE